MRTPEELEALIPSSAFQAVIIHIPCVDFDHSESLEDELIELMDPTDFGYHDGNEIGGGETTLWLFGKDAEQVFSHIAPTLCRNSFCKGATVTLRYGEYGSKERTFSL